jgi:hypothetical protein
MEVGLTAVVLFLRHFANAKEESNYVMVFANRTTKFAYKLIKKQNYYEKSKEIIQARIKICKRWSFRLCRSTEYSGSSTSKVSL